MSGTCTFGDLSGCCLCPIRGLCCDIELILCSWSQVSDVILSGVSDDTPVLLGASPGHIVSVGFLGFRWFRPCNSDGLLLW